MLSACKQSEKEDAAAPVAAGAANANQPQAAQPAPAPVPPAPAPNEPVNIAPLAPPVSASAARPLATIRATSAPATTRSGEKPTLVAVRSGRHARADRLVFEFNTAGLPAWHVEYVDRPVRDCGSGEPVPVAGDGWLQIRFSGAQAHTDIGKPTSGPQRRALPLRVARELVRTCDFEGEVTWVVGVGSPNPYAVRSMAKPSRLVVEIAY